jgi:hypothetical protein
MYTGVWYDQDGTRITINRPTGCTGTINIQNILFDLTYTVLSSSTISVYDSTSGNRNTITFNSDSSALMVTPSGDTSSLTRQITIPDIYTGQWKWIDGCNRITVTNSSVSGDGQIISPTQFSITINGVQYNVYFRTGSTGVIGGVYDGATFRGNITMGPNAAVCVPSGSPSVPAPLTSRVPSPI